MGSAAKSVSGIAIEQQQGGLYPILVDTAVSSLPAGPTNTVAASGSTTGLRLLIRVYGHTATGTITVAGTAVNTLAAVTETTTTLALPQNTAVPAEYLTSAVYGVITASTGISVSGLTNGRVVIYGMQAAKRLLPGEFKLSDKQKEFSPTEQRGTFDKDYFLLPLAKECMAEFTGPLYGDSSTFLYYGGFNAAPTVTTIGSTAAVLGATSIVTGSSVSAAVQPTAPGMVLQCVITGGPGSSQSITVAGTNEYGQSVTEVITTTKSNGTYYSVNRFASISANGITYGAFGGAASLAITGFLGYTLSNAGPGDTLASFAAENYDSTGSFGAPWWLLDEWQMEGGADKEHKVTAKGPCQDVQPAGVLATTTNQVTAFGVPIDQPITGWQTVYSIDAQTGTPGTTQWADVIDYKVSVKLDQKFKYTSWGNPPYRVPNRAYRNRRHVEIELTVDETATTFNAEYKNWQEQRYRYVQLQVRGNIIANVTGTNFYLGPTIILPVKWSEEPQRDYSVGQESPIIKLKGVAHFDASLGYSHKLTWNTVFPSW